MTPEIEYLTTDGARLAYRRSLGRGAPGCVWLGGFHSDMEGEKASTLHAAAADRGLSFVRFDYFGHGKSEGRFEDGRISRWRADTLSVLDTLTEGPQVLFGSSMGAWLAILAALARPARIAGLVLIAPAPDFTEALMWERFTPDQKGALAEAGAVMRTSPWDPAGYPITRGLIEDGRRWLLLADPIPVQAPVRMLHGDCDEDVPLDHVLRLFSRLAGDDLRLTLIRGGDHRLSRPSDLGLLVSAMDELSVPCAS